MFRSKQRMMAAVAAIGATCFLGACAQSNASFKQDIVAEIEEAITTARATTGPGRPPLWQMSDDDTVIHMFGSVHLLKPETVWRYPELDAAFEASDRVVFETYDVEPDGTDEFSKLILRHGFFSDGTKLTDLLNAKEEAIIRDGFKSINLSLEGLNGLAPWNATLSAVVTLALQEGYDPELGVDIIFEQAAEAMGKRLLYLETPRDQFEALSAGSQRDQLDALVYTAASMEVSPKFLDVMISEWAEGDMVGQAAIDAAGDEYASSEMLDALLLNRNEKWVPQIIEMLEEPGEVFIVVGAAHLSGDDSVIALLREQGFEVNGPL